MRLWRIVRSRHADHAFSGVGATRFSGRWNPAGFAMAYASEHLSLSAIELFVHLTNEDETSEFHSIEAEFPWEDAEVVTQKREMVAKLPKDWRTQTALTQQLGANFIEGARSATKFVPSVVIPGEWNILLNPAHPRFVDLKVLDIRRFQFDPRMFERKG